MCIVLIYYPLNIARNVAEQIALIPQALSRRTELAAANSRFKRDSREIEIDCSTWGVRWVTGYGGGIQRVERVMGKELLDFASKSCGWEDRSGRGRDKPK